jgi:LPXTG-site transpeptidase (sortase) family protein
MRKAGVAALPQGQKSPAVFLALLWSGKSPRLKDAPWGLVLLWTAKRTRLGLPIMAVLAGLFVLYSQGFFARLGVAKSFGAQITSPADTIQNLPVHAPLSGKPVRIILPSLGLDLPVIDGTYDPASQEWTLSRDMAQYATITPPVNNHAGNTLIYGHNNRHVFAKLSQLQVGSEAIVETSNQHRFHYRLRTSYEVQPSDLSIFSYHGRPILTIQTCSGVWFENRNLFVFDYLRVD